MVLIIFKSYFEHIPPCDSSSLTNFRKRIGEEGLNFVLAHSIELAQKGRLLKKSDLQRATIDTTVQEKHIRFPTDSRLLHRVQTSLVEAAQKQEISLRQTYKRVGKRALIKRNKYAHARQMKRAKKQERKLRTYLRRTLTDINRKCEMPDSELKKLLEIGTRVLNQKRTDKNKIYSIHEPHVALFMKNIIAKGKAHKPRKTNRGSLDAKF